MELNLQSPDLQQEPIAPQIEDIPLHATPLPNLSDEAVAQADIARQQVEGQTTYDDFKAAVKDQDFILPALDHVLNEHNFPVDVNWQGPTPEMLEEAKVPQDMQPMLYNTLSEDHYMKQLGELQNAMANEQTIEDYGVKGAWLRFGMNLLDPGNLAIAATLPLAEVGVPEALMMHKLGRLGSAVRGGILAGAENAGVQALINEANPLGTNEDVAYAALFGIGFGGAVGGAFHRNTSQVIEDNALQVIRAIDEKNSKATVGGNAGAAEVSGPAANQSLADNPLTPEELNAPEAVMSKFRFDSASQVANSGMDSARKAGNDLMEDAVGKKGHALNSEGGAASAIQRQTYKAWNIDMRKSVEPHVAEYKKSLPIQERFLHPIKIREDFFRQVTRHIELEDSVNPQVQKAADGFRDLYARMLDEQQGAKVFGSDAIPKDRRYTPHIWEPQRVRAMVDETNVATVSRLFQLAMTKGVDVSPEEAVYFKRVADSLVKKFDNRASAVDDMQGFHLNLTDAEELKVLMRDVGEEMDDDVIETIVNSVLKKQRDVGKASHLKRRMDLDMSASVLHPKTGKELTLYDLIETDAEKAALRYMQKASGLVGLARKGYGNTKSATADIAALKQRIENEGRTKGIDKDTIDRTLNNISVTADNILGKPMDTLQRTAGGRALRAATDAAFIRFMGQTGAASVAELGQAIGYAGVINAVRQLAPSMHRAFDRMAVGDDVSKTLSTELEAVGAWGGHRLNNQVSSRYNDHDVEFLSSSFRRLDAGLQIGKQLTVKYSGLGLITDFSQEFAARALSQKLYNQAMRAGTGSFEDVWKKDWKRFHLYGLSKPKAEKIFAQIRKHSEGTKSKYFKTEKLGRFNLDKWDKTELDDFTHVMFRMVTHAVQETDVGNMASWMHKDLAKAFMQFRSFVAGSYTRATLNGIHMRDTQAAVGFTASMAFGWVSYMAQQHINSVGKEDGWLERRIETDRQLAALYSRSAFASFTPAIMDFFLELGGQDQVFNHTRSSGQSQLTLPAWEMLNSARSLGQIGASAITPREVTEGDMDSAMGLLPNMWIFRNVTAAIDEGFDLPQQQQDN